MSKSRMTESKTGWQILYPTLSRVDCRWWSKQQAPYNPLMMLRVLQQPSPQRMSQRGLNMVITMPWCNLPPEINTVAHGYPCIQLLVLLGPIPFTYIQSWPRSLNQCRSGHSLAESVSGSAHIDTEATQRHREMPIIRRHPFSHHVSGVLLGSSSVPPSVRPSMEPDDSSWLDEAQNQILLVNDVNHDGRTASVNTQMG